MSISEPFIRRPIATSLMMLGVLVFGIGAYGLLPVAALPKVDFPTIVVAVNYPGASPDTMASAIATPLEQQFATIPSLDQMTSTSGIGSLSITLQFDLERNIDAAAQDVQTAINAASGVLPKDLPTPPTYRKTNPADRPVMIYAVHSDALPIYRVDHYAYTILAQQIATLKRTSEARVPRQQRANTRERGNSIQTLRPRREESFPPSVKGDLVSDRSLVVKAAVHDVQFTMMLTIGLVSIVIFVFLRTMWATVIPSLAVPLSLLATFGVMYAVGYSLDNISLMALTISVGFVVDDAIVMIENIVRYLEKGDRPLEAALKGAGQIGFTIISITFSLIAVFIPLLFMGGIIGRLFREFAVTVSVAVVASCFISLTLTPVLCSLFLQGQGERPQGRANQWADRC